MRRSKQLIEQNNISILAVDDDPIITDTIQDYFKRSGYQVEAENNPQVAVDRIRNGNYDILLLDFLMSPICGDQVVAEIREFNRDLFIILLTGHKSMAPPVKTIRQLDIQGYYEKDDRFDQLELLVESCVKSIKQMRILREYEADLSATVENMHQLYHLQSRESIATTMLQMAQRIVPNAGVFVSLEHPSEQFLRTSGEEVTADTCRALMAQADWNGQNMAMLPQWCLLRLTDAQQRFEGVLGIRMESAFRTEKLQLLNILARQASAAIANSYLHSHVNLQNAQLEEAYMQTIQTLRFAVETRDKETRGHSERVSNLARALAHSMGLPDDQVRLIHTAGLFHDIGKIGIPDAILLKNGPLTQDEFREIQNHPVMGEHILEEYEPLKEALPIIRGHHERFDGSGYPDHLAGQNICLSARIIAVADSFDAMISNRTYRQGLSLEKTMQELHKGKSTQFDPQIVDALVSMMQQMGEDVFRENFCSHNSGNEQGAYHEKISFE